VRTWILPFCVFLLARLAGAGAPLLPPGPVAITIEGEVPSSGDVGKEWEGPFTTTVEGGTRDEGVPAGQVTWKWFASAIKDDPTNEDDDETGIGQTLKAIETKFTPATGSHKTELALQFREVGRYFVKVVVEFSKKRANITGSASRESSKSKSSPTETDLNDTNSSLKGLNPIALGC
jgi:hypothetical protein